MIAAMISRKNPARPRARDLGIPFDGTPGPRNSITDVAGVEVGHATIISGGGESRRGKAAVRTGVTAIMPRGRSDSLPAFAGCFVLNGNGEMTGTAWIEESGLLTTPLTITNTHSVGVVRDAVIAWIQRQPSWRRPWVLPVVAETWDGWLNDIDGFHVSARHTLAALNGARSGSTLEGCVGGGTGMIGYGWKGGIGTASRQLPGRNGGWTIGVLVQLNCGRSHELVIAGKQVGKLLRPAKDPFSSERGSIIMAAATDAPLLPHQLKRIARRLTIGLGRTGSVSGNGSGDLFIAFSTVRVGAAGKTGVIATKMLSNEFIDPLFTVAVQASEEAIVNALVAAETMTGFNNHRIEAIPHDDLREIFAK